MPEEIEVADPPPTGQDQPQPPAPEPSLADQIRDDPLMQELLKGMGELPAPPAAPEDGTPPTPAPGEAPPAPPVPAPTDAAPPVTSPAPPEPPPPRPPKRVLIDLPQDLEQPIQPTPTPTPTPRPPAPPPAADPDAEYIAALPEESREELEIADIAERALPTYVGQRKKLVAWYRQIDEMVGDLRKADPNRSFDGNDEEYQRRFRAMQATKPIVKRSDERKVLAQIERARVKEEVLGELAPKIEEVEVKQRDLLIKPKIDAVTKAFADGVKKLLAGSETLAPVMKELEAGGDAAAPYALESDIIADRTAKSAEMAAELIRIRQRATKFDVDRLTPIQRELDEFIATQGEDFARNGGKHRINSAGQSFVPLQRWHTMARQIRAGTLASNALDGHWTMSDRMIIELLLVRAKSEIEAEIESVTARSAKYGFKRETKPSNVNGNPTNPPAPKPTTTPRAKPTPAPGPGPKPKEEPTVDAAAVMSIATDLKLD